MKRVPSVVRAAVRGVVGLAALASAGLAGAQPTGSSPLSPPTNGVRRADSTWHALTNATVHTAPGKVLQDATVVIRDGRIAAVGPGAEVKTDGCRVWDCSGLTIYPGFIDAYVEVEAPQPGAEAPGVHWNTRVTPQVSALDGAGLDERTAEALRKMGFTSAAIAPTNGIFRGRAAVVSLAQPAGERSVDRPPVYREDAYQSVSFDTRGGGGGRGDTPDNARWSTYPNSQMGAIALIRQTLIDADWQQEAREAGAEIAPNAIDHLAAGATAPLLFNTGDELEALRAAKIAREFERKAMILGNGTEFRRLEAVKADGLAIVLPLAFPRTPDVTSVGKADSVELSELMTWEQAPTNPRRLDAAGLRIALTTSKSRSRADFSENLSKAMKHGLAPERALAMLTTQPAELLGVSDRLGTIEPGKVASLIVADGDLFQVWSGEAAATERRSDEATEGEEKAGGEEKKDEGEARSPRPKRAKIRDVWIDGVRHEINAAPHQAAGTWALTEIDGETMPTEGAEAVIFTITPESAITYRHKGKTARATNVRIQDNRVEYAVDTKELFGIPTVLMDSAVIEGEEMHGFTPMPNGSIHRWSARRLSRDVEVRPGEGAARDGERPARAAAGQREGARDVDGEAKQADAGAALPSQPELSPPDREAKVRELIEEARKHQRAGETEKAKESLERLLAIDPENPTGLLLRDLFSDDRITGLRSAPRGDRAARPARSSEPRKSAEELEREAIAAVPEQYGCPFGPYMVEQVPEQKNIAFTGATIWTGGPAGIIENGVLYIAEGKVAFVGAQGEWNKWIENKRLANLDTVDLKGKHIAPGIIDCHSHTGISRGVNESGQAVTAEVRIGDVTDPDAISWYRQLASGVTAVNNLHGSANAIGGQNQVNKIRWGVAHPDQMHFEGAKGGIKFALGENPKQSNWGERNTTRYPQTRMGVEMLIRDRFTAAREYAKTLADAGLDVRFNALADQSGNAPSRGAVLASAGNDPPLLGTTPIVGTLFTRAPKLPPRRDLELEALAEILAGERLVHCHSYRQDEILMLCRVAQEFGFKIGTFQHILEGYKVADEIAKVALGASAFSDWWAYKVEVQDAIPQGGPIMYEQGVVVSYNSDSDELARRLNGEAAKAVKYGGLDEHEALKFVTLNPAKQLAVADRVGSLEVGKDADFAIWSRSPLSSMARCEATYIDGRCYFSLEKDKQHRERITKERHRLIQKAMAAGRGSSRGEDGPPAAFSRRRPGDEDHRARIMREHYLDMINRGGDPNAARPGECGCGLMH